MNTTLQKRGGCGGAEELLTAELEVVGQQCVFSQQCSSLSFLVSLRLSSAHPSNARVQRENRSRVLRKVSMRGRIRDSSIGS